MAMTKCKECGNELSTKADACPKCGAKVSKTSVPAKGCLVVIVLFFGLAAIGALIGKDKSSESASDAEPTAVEPARASAEVVSLADLLGQYKGNEVRADGLFKGKIIQTTGKVVDVKKGMMGEIYVTVGTGQQFEIPKVQCFFDKSKVSIVSQLNGGDTVTVQGRVGGLMMNVLVRECELVSN